MPMLIASGNFQWNAWALASGSTSTVRFGESVEGHQAVVLKELTIRSDERHEKFFDTEIAAYKLLNAEKTKNRYVPILVAVIKERWTIVLGPVASRLRAACITTQFV